MSFDTLPWACIHCGARGDSKDKCPSCSADGMMDLRDASVRVELIKEDDERQSKRRQLMIWISVPSAMLLALIFGMGICGFAIGGAGGYGLSLVLAAIFPAKRLFPYARG
ncbi:MAG: hypothetical protein AB1938_00510 [Myxococcota bacterium]